MGAHGHRDRLGPGVRFVFGAVSCYVSDIDEVGDEDVRSRRLQSMLQIIFLWLVSNNCFRYRLSECIVLRSYRSCVLLIFSPVSFKSQYSLRQVGQFGADFL